MPDKATGKTLEIGGECCRTKYAQAKNQQKIDQQNSIR